MAGKFIRGELSVFAYDMNRITLVLPYQQVLIGTARRSLSDSNGVAFIRCLTDIAGHGGGSLFYISQNPGDNNQEGFMLSSVMPVNSEWSAGSGICLPEVPATFNTTERDNPVGRVNEVQRYTQVQGAKKAIADFNDRNGTFADGSRYIVAYAYNGTTLALPFQPEMIGTNRMNFSDPL
ncbi:MAG: hypothetical protein EHM53_13625 [Methanoregulaceae archaeon]|nr:MAG: hypothetical protein EHM53_13625 [Methanoregulaceae archaeon]